MIESKLKSNQIHVISMNVNILEIEKKHEKHRQHFGIQVWIEI